MWDSVRGLVRNHPSLFRHYIALDGISPVLVAGSVDGMIDRSENVQPSCGAVLAPDSRGFE